MALLKGTISQTLFALLVWGGGSGRWNSSCSGSRNRWSRHSSCFAALIVPGIPQQHHHYLHQQRLVGRDGSGWVFHHPRHHPFVPRGTMTMTTRQRISSTTGLQMGSRKILPTGSDPDEVVPMTPKRSRSPNASAAGGRSPTTTPRPPTTTQATLTSTLSSPVATTKKKPRRGSSTTISSSQTNPDLPAVPVTPEPTSVVRQRRRASNQTISTPTTTTTSSTASTEPILEKQKKSTSKNTKRKQQQQQPRPPPKEDWQSIYQLVQELRRDRTAPVDTNGSEALPQRDLGPATFRFQVLIALMLSSQTKDGVVGDAMRTLQAHGLTLDHLRCSTSFEELNDMIVKVGFHNTKAKNILKVAELLHTNYSDDIPPTAQEMMEVLPGVGPKMAFIVENVAWGRTTGIGVDTHMHRMFNQLHWVNSTQPEQTRLQLESWLPVEYWSTVNVLWVGMGQEVQQFQDKLLRKCLDCSKPKEALKLVQRLGLDFRKVGTKMGWMTEIEAVLHETKTT